MSKRPTISDVARQAGVSTVTVSRVLSGSEQVREATRLKVNAAIEELGYFGNSVARQLVSGRPETIGIVTTDTSAYGYARTISGIERRARAAGMICLICVLDRSDAKASQEAVRAMLSHPLAGVVVVDFDADAHRALVDIPNYMPVVVVGEPHVGAASGRPYIAIDEYDGAYALTQCLIDAGHVSIFVMAQPNNDPPERRSIGALDALRDAHLPMYPPIRCQSWEPAAGYDTAQQILAEYGPRVTALVCANDELAIGAMRALREAGLRVPEDVSVTGFDGMPIARLTTPSLATVSQDFDRVGNLAVELLLEHADNPDGARGMIEVCPDVLTGESIAPPNPERGMVVASPARANSGT